MCFACFASSRCLFNISTMKLKALGVKPPRVKHCSKRALYKEGKNDVLTTGFILSLQGVRARQRSRYLRFSRPPQEKVLQESRKKLMKEKNAANFLRWEAVSCDFPSQSTKHRRSSHRCPHFNAEPFWWC